MIRNAYLQVHPMSGGDLRELCNELVRLAARMEMQVRCTANGVTLIANPEGTGSQLFAFYENAVKHHLPCAVTL